MTRDRVILHDATDRSLSVWWRLGNAIDGTPHHYAVRSPMDALSRIELHCSVYGPIRELQLWCHGNAFGAYIDGKRIRTIDLIAALSGCVTGYLWLRACEVAESPRLIERLARELDVTVVAHTHRISAEPIWRPLRQGGLVALRPGKLAFWNRHDRYKHGPKKGKRLPGCSVLRMTPPSRATVDGGRVF